MNKLFSKCQCGKSRVHKTDSDSNTNTNDVEEDENKHHWDRPLEFVLSLISNSVGLGNVWRFPYLAAKNGGGAFLIPYFILYFLVGAPLYYLELALGQFTSRGPASGFIHARGWQGVGFSMVINSVLGTLYYNVLIAWALFYFILSFRTRLLWADCGNWWNSKNCFVPGKNTTPTVDYNNTNCTLMFNANMSSEGCEELSTDTKVPVTEEFFYRLLLNKSASFDDFGVPGTYMTLLLFVSWIIICLCIIRGVQSTGKVAYFTAIFPYVVLLVLIIFTATLEGAGDGIKYYLIPKWELLGNFEIWQAAASQVFFSLSLGYGCLIAYAAANPFKNQFFQQMCIVVACDCFTGVFAGFAVFATIGFLAKSLDEPVEVYAQTSGPGLAFITYPEALARMPASSFFSIIFFLMLLALGLGSQFATTDVPVTALMEFFPSYAGKRHILVIITCIVFFLASIPFACPGGLFLFELFQEYTANISLVFVGFFEVFSVAYIYGFDRFMNDIKMMLGRRTAQYYAFVTWCITAPLLTLILTISNILNSSELKLEATGGFPAYEFPRWSTILGWLIFVMGIIPVPIVFVVSYIREFRRISAERKSNQTNRTGDDGQPSEENLSSEEKPVFLAALTANNSPADNWGPRRRADWVGAYSRLIKPSKKNTRAKPKSPRPSTPAKTNENDADGTINPTFNPDSL